MPSKAPVPVCQAAPKREQVFKLRCQGLTFQAIADKMVAEGYQISPSRVSTYVQEELASIKARTRELAESLRMIRLKNVQDLLGVYFIDAISGNTKAGEMVLKLMERESRYLGMDAPTKTQEIKDGNPFDNMSLDELREEARKRNIPIQLEVEDHGDDTRDNSSPRLYGSIQELPGQTGVESEQPPK